MNAIDRFHPDSGGGMGLAFLWSILGHAALAVSLVVVAGAVLDDPPPAIGLEGPPSSGRLNPAHGYLGPDLESRRGARGGSSPGIVMVEVIPDLQGEPGPDPEGLLTLPPVVARPSDPARAVPVWRRPIPRPVAVGGGGRGGADETGVPHFEMRENGVIVSSSPQSAHSYEIVPVRQVIPDYPLEARGRIEGLVVLDVKVGSSGKVLEVAIAESPGYRTLEQSAVTAMYQWEFRPYRPERGEASAFIIRVPFRYRIERD